MAVADEGWDLIMFADCVYSGSGGEALPHALVELLQRGRPGAIAVGVFPPDLRAGIDKFWAQAAEAGLVPRPVEKSCAPPGALHAGPGDGFDLPFAAGTGLGGLARCRGRGWRRPTMG